MQVCLITNPIWVIKTRLQLQRATSLRSSAAKAARRVSSTRASPYRGFTHAVARIAREEGFAGFYRGLLPSLLLVLLPNSLPLPEIFPLMKSSS